MADQLGAEVSHFAVCVGVNVLKARRSDIGCALSCN